MKLPGCDGEGMLEPYPHRIYWPLTSPGLSLRPGKRGCVTHCALTTAHSPTQSSISLGVYRDGRSGLGAAGDWCSFVAAAGWAPSGRA